MSKKERLKLQGTVSGESDQMVVLLVLTLFSSKLLVLVGRLRIIHIDKDY